MRDLQAFLASLGFDPGPVDGLDGPRTRAAMEAVRDALTAPAAAPEIDANTAALIRELERDEGRVLHAYTDHLGYWTIGIGRLIDKRRGGGISNDEADMLKRNDVLRFQRELDQRLPWWRGLDPVRQRAIQNMAFQMGVSGLLGFKSSLAAIQSGDWPRAAANMRKSLWAKQTPQRAARVIGMIETGRAA